MTSFAAKFVAKKLFRETTANKQGQEDPYFESVPASRLGFKTKKKVAKALPPGLTRDEEKTLIKAKRRAYRVDMALGSFLGMKIGWGAVIGLVPGFGDVADMLLALMVFRTICSVKPELDASTKMRMQINIVIDFVIGIIPFVGDIADAAYKCNTRNVVIFESVLRKRGQKRIKGTPQANQTDWSLPDQWEYQEEEERLNAQHGPPPDYTSRQPSRRDRDREDRRDRRDRRDRQDYDVESGRNAPPPHPARTR